MASYLIPPKDTLKALTFTPAQLIADAAFDDWHYTNKYEFVRVFHNAWRRGQPNITYTGSQDDLTIIYNALTSTAYGYTVTNPTLINGSSTQQYTITITFPS